MSRIAGVACLCLITVCFAACNGNDSKTKTQATDSSGNVIVYPPKVQSLIDAVNKYPDSNDLRFALVISLDSIGDVKNAVRNADSLIRKDSTNYKYWFNRGLVEEDAKDTLQAMVSYATAIHIYESPDAMLSLANLYAETRNQRALLFCSRVKSLSLGKDYDAHSAFITGVYYARIGKGPEAIQAFDECIANNYTYMVAYIEKGLVYFDEKKYDEALKVFQFASTVDNLYADCYYYQARCYEMMGKKDLAIEKFKQALTLDKTMTEAHVALRRLGAE